ncbi:hypothetical protein BDY19DRAFT_905142 [Irpex rosettiformis]|uniref:Uncharacterized protein n=1 Tax=Irpex rosettiformis TaxID=378272 RepID=A0ACB8U777_9APHY|nr:hypothetical protein BDY19DRAFT_905142 [Irpex rosettiformis]
MGLLYHEMTYEEFLDHFATIQGERNKSETLPQFNKRMNSKFDGILDVEKESSMYPILCGSMNKVLHLAALRRTDEISYRFMDVANWPESDTEDLKFDIAMYPNPESTRAKATFNNVKEDEKSFVEPSRSPHVARNAWAWVTVGVEVIYDVTRSAFFCEDENDFADVDAKTVDSPPSLLRDSRRGRKAQAQLAEYATEMMIRQHRSFYTGVSKPKDPPQLHEPDIFTFKINISIPERAESRVPAQVVPEPSSPHRGVLNQHEPIMRVFQKYIEALLAKKTVSEDTTQDQFDGLLEVVLVGRRRKADGSSLSSSRTSRSDVGGDDISGDSNEKDEES